METDEKEISKDKQVIRRVVSRLCFIREDLRAIQKMNIKTEEIKTIIKGMENRAELLLDMFFPKRGRRWKT